MCECVYVRDGLVSLPCDMSTLVWSSINIDCLSQSLQVAFITSCSVVSHVRTVKAHCCLTLVKLLERVHPV